MLYLQRSLFLFVGVPGFEPGTPWSQTRCATGLRYTPMTFVVSKDLASFKSVAKVSIFLKNTTVLKKIFWK